MLKVSELDVYNPTVVHPLIAEQIKYQAPEVLNHSYIEHQVNKIARALSGDKETLSAVMTSYQHIINNYKD